MLVLSHADEYQLLDVRLMGTISDPQVNAHPVFWFSVCLRCEILFQANAGSAYWVCAGVGLGDSAFETFTIR